MLGLTAAVALAGAAPADAHKAIAAPIVATLSNAAARSDGQSSAACPVPPKNKTWLGVWNMTEGSPVTYVNHWPSTGSLSLTLKGDATIVCSSVSIQPPHVGSCNIATVYLGKFDASGLTMSGTYSSQSNCFGFIAAGTWSAAAAIRPVVKALKPPRGPSRGGTQVLIKGRYFVEVTAVLFGSVASPSFTVSSPTSISAATPSEATGVAFVTVITTAGGQSSGRKFRFR